MKRAILILLMSLSAVHAQVISNKDCVYKISSNRAELDIHLRIKKKTAIITLKGAWKFRRPCSGASIVSSTQEKTVIKADKDVLLLLVEVD